MNAFYRLCVLLAFSCLVCLESRAQAQDPSEGVAYALFYGNVDRPTVNGNTADGTAAKAAQQVIGAKFMMWFRLDGRAYVSPDMATMEKVSQLLNTRFWQPSVIENAERPKTTRPTL